MLGVLQSPNFRRFEPNSKIRAVNEQTIELLQTLLQHYNIYILILSAIFFSYFQIYNTHFILANKFISVPIFAYWYLLMAKTKTQIPGFRMVAD